MEHVQLGSAAIVLLALAGTMVIYERARQNAKRPLFDGREIVTLYWVGYLTFFVLGLTCAVGAIVR
jgi:hypothetical protein